VLNHNNIEVLVIEGNNNQRKRMATLQEFKSSGRKGPRVLLISSVGALGLNIAFANVLIIVVCAHRILRASKILMCYDRMFSGRL
jgi:superfamily II DNA/RNA helicase